MKKRPLTKMEKAYFRDLLGKATGEALQRAKILEMALTFAAFLHQERGYEMGRAVEMATEVMALVMEVYAKRARSLQVQGMITLELKPGSKAKSKTRAEADSGADPDYPDLPPGDPPEVKIPALDEMKDGGGQEKG